MGNRTQVDWIPLYLKEAKNVREIQNAVAQIMQVQTDNILMSQNREWEQMSQTDQKHHLVCQLENLEGDFPICVWIIPFPAMNSNLPAYDIEHVCQLAKMLDTDILARDESIDPFDPYTRFLVQPNCTKRLIELDIELLNNDNVFKINHYI